MIQNSWAARKWWSKCVRTLCAVAWINGVENVDQMNSWTIGCGWITPKLFHVWLWHKQQSTNDFTLDFKPNGQTIAQLHYWPLRACNFWHVVGVIYLMKRYLNYNTMTHGHCLDTIQFDSIHIGRKKKTGSAIKSVKLVQCNFSPTAF